MSKKYISILNIETMGEKGWAYWQDMTGLLNTRQEAVAWIRKNIGPCDDEGNICLIDEFEIDDEVGDE